MKAYCLSKGSKLNSPHYVLFHSTNDTNDCKSIFTLICGFHKKSFIMNAPLIGCPFPFIRFGWVFCCIHPQRMTGNEQLTRGAFIINDCLRNPHFSNKEFWIVYLLKILILGDFEPIKCKLSCCGGLWLRTVFFNQIHSSPLWNIT